MKRNIGILIMVATVNNIPGYLFAQDSPLNNIRNEIASELHLVSIGGQDELLERYASTIEKYDETFTTDNVEFNRDTSVLTSYAYATLEFTKKYNPDILETHYQSELSPLCNQSHVIALRSAGFTHRLQILNREDGSVFLGFEIGANKQEAEFADILRAHKLYARRKARQNGDKAPVEISESCIFQLDWRVAELKSELNSADKTEQERCEILKRMELLEDSDVDIYDYRETPFVIGVKARYQDYIDRICTR